MSQIFGARSYAQHGDDFMLVNIFSLIGIQKPSYVDLGAHHPTEISNTHLLYLRGSRGVNVEANLNLMDEFKRLRPEDKNICIGVAPTAGMKKFYMLDPTSGLNSFSETEIAKVRHNHPVRHTTDLVCVTINDIIRDHHDGKWPDLLLTDIEGFDHEVLESAVFNWTDRPKVICSEIRPEESKRTIELLDNRGYYVYCRVQANLIFVHKFYHSQLYL